LKGVILAAGEGTRLRPLTFTVPKPLIPIMGRPLVEYILEALASSGIREYVFVIGYLGNLFKEQLGDGSRLGVRISYVLQERRLGIAHAIYRAIDEGGVDGPFAVHLGDNFFDDDLSRYVRAFSEGEWDVYILLTRVKDPSKFGYVVLEGGRPAKLIEKPKNPPPGGYTLAGLYIFRDPDAVKRAFSSLRPSARGEYEITDLIQWFIDNRYRVGYSIVSSWWKDTGNPGDLLDLVLLMLDKAGERVEGDVRGEVVGRAVVERGAVVEGRVHGPAYIGRGAYIGRDSYIEHYVDVESEASISSGRLSRCLIMGGARLDLGKARLVDSIIGPRSEVIMSSGTYTIVIGESNRVAQQG